MQRFALETKARPWFFRGCIYNCIYNSEAVVIKKMIEMLDQDEKKLFFKEVELLNGLRHTNIVKLKG